MASRAIPYMLVTLSFWVGVAQSVHGETGSAASVETVRELYVPFDELAALLEKQPQRVLLSRSEYETLLRQARREPAARAPRSAMLVSADYAIAVGRGRADVIGTITVEVLEEGLHAVDLDIDGVGLRTATLDGRGASIGRRGGEGIKLFVEGAGRHELVLHMVARVETTAARQSLAFRVPTPPTTRLRLSVSGNIEIKRGAYVVSREFDEAAQVTRFELLPKPVADAVINDERLQVSRVASAPGFDTVSLVMSLNNRLLQTEALVVARSVIVDEITEAEERLHATFSMAVLHRPVDRFRFALPIGFELTEVKSPSLSHWVVEGDGSRRVLEVRLREPTVQTVVIKLSGVSTGDASRLMDWTLPRIEPLNVTSQAAVVGLLLGDRLKVTSLTSEKLIPIDTGVLREVFPATLRSSRGRAAGAPRLRAVAAYYAPIGTDTATVVGRFEKPAAALSVMTSLLLTLEEKNLQLRGGFALQPEVETIYSVEFSAPRGWRVDGVNDAAGHALAFDVYGSDVGADARIRVQLRSGVPPGSAQSIHFHAVHTPTGWLSDWDSMQVGFPVFAVVGASRDEGAIAVQVGEGLTVYPETLERLTPLDTDEKAAFGLTDGTALNESPAYRYEDSRYRAILRVERIAPRVTAKTYSFFRVGRELLTAHYEIAYEVEEAHTRQLSLLLPVSTPADVSIRGLGGVSIKEYEGTVTDGMRRWTVLLAERGRDTVRLAVDFEQRYDDLGDAEWELPIVRADDVVYQSGWVSVEGGPEVDLKITSHPREVDVGELARASYRPDRTVLGPPRGGGVFAFVSDKPEVKVRIARPPVYALPPAIVQRAELVTMVSDHGIAQTAARFHLRVKSAFLQIELPAGSTLWSAELDGAPTKPQSERGRLLLSLPARSADILRDLRVVYETPVGHVTFQGDLNLAAPKLLLRTEGTGTPNIEVPVADLDWRLFLPSGYEIVADAGTMTGRGLPQPEPAAWDVARFLYRLSGGVRPFHYLPSLSRARELSPRMMSNLRGIGTSSRVYYDLSSEGLRGSERASRRTRSKVGEKKETPARRSKAKSLPENAVAKIMRDASGEGEARTQARSGGKDGEVVAGADDLKSANRPVGGKGRLWALEGVRSLKIDLEPSGTASAFQSLGHDPLLSVTLVSTRRVQSLAWGLAFCVGLIGLWLTRRTARTKAMYVVVLLAVATLVPLLVGGAALMYVANAVVYVVSSLVPFYLAARIVKWLASIVRRSPPVPLTTTSALALVLMLGTVARGDPPLPGGQESDPLFVHLVESAGPIDVPEDAVIILYDPRTSSVTTPGVPQGDQLLIPYRTYVELWSLAHPVDAMSVDTGAAAPGYALAGAAYSATLGDDHDLQFEGYLDIDVHTDEPLTVPLQLGGGVLSRAVLDGAPARLAVGPAVLEQEPRPAQQNGYGTSTAPLLLQVTGKGRHRLELTVRLKLRREGGWSVAAGEVPTAPATSLTLRVPRAGTEVQLSGFRDRRYYETTSAEETIDTALTVDGPIRIQWRPKVREGHIDPTLTARSDVLFDVREDGLRLTGEVNLDFGRTERDAFTVTVPGDYLVQTIDGPNVRGWVTRPAAADGIQSNQEIRVTLLKPSRRSGRVVMVLHHTKLIDETASANFAVPVIGVVGAVLHEGRLTIRRSPLLRLQTGFAAGVTRTDAPSGAVNLSNLAGAGRASPIGVQVYQAYRFAATPFDLRLTASVRRSQRSAEVHTVVRIGERERTLETRINIAAWASPVYRVSVVVPDDLKIDQVDAPGAFEWSVTTQHDRRTLTVYLATGRENRFGIRIRGVLGGRGPIEELALPRLDVLDVSRQQGDIVIEADPALGVHVAHLQQCHELALERTYPWLGVEQRPLARLALRYDSPEYAGLLRLSSREPMVTCSTITNVRITEAAVEETILLDFNIVRAGVRTISFLLPAWMKDAHITLPMLRRKTMEPVSDAADSEVRVRLQLLDDVMGRLRILVENDRLLTSQTQRTPIPIVETGRTERQFMTLENAGRDEVVIDELMGLEPLSRQQKEWRILAELLGGAITQAYVVSAGNPILSFKTRERAVVETAGARIGFAEAIVVVDAHGAYRAAQSYRVDNLTEQFLDVDLPQGATLWSVQVAGDPVKPARTSGTADPRRVRIPLVRTAAGDLDYIVILKYGGHMPPPGALRRVDFPLIRTVNVSVELSQVRLFLPRTHRWFAFGGTMRRTVAAGDLAAGYVRYQTRQTERLIRAMQSDSPFTQVRAVSNLGKLKSRMDRFRGTTSPYARDVSVATEFATNEAVVRQAEEQSRRLAVTQRPQGKTEDNRGKLNTLYGRQKIARGRNLVQALPDNFRPNEQRARQAQERPSRFSRDWLEANQLLDANLLAESAGDRVEEIPLREARLLRMATLPAASPEQLVERLKMKKGPASPKDERLAQQQQQARRRGRSRGGTKRAVAEYQQQLQQQSPQPQPSVGVRSYYERAAAADISQFISPSSNEARIAGSGVGWGDDATGLASLVVDVPVRGAAYLFTTPRGDVTISGRAVTNRFIEQLRRIALVLVVIVVAGALYRVLRRRGLSWLGSRSWSAVLIGLGFAGAVIGVLPVLGLVLIVSGVVARVRSRRRERTAALA